MNCWLNLYKPKGISSAKLVSLVKKRLPPKTKIGHCGTLDLEAEGILPLAIGQATKLVRFLMDAKKEYIFTIQFGASTDTGDAAGNIINSTNHYPSLKECQATCAKFLGEITQIPPNFSALKVQGQRAYDLARRGLQFELNPRQITIYKLKCQMFDDKTKRASFIAECSKGTYIRTLAEDIALSLQSLGFVIELRRTRVGIFNCDNSIKFDDFEGLDHEAALKFLGQNNMKIETVLDDILVLEATKAQATQIRHGQKCYFENVSDNIELLWIRFEGQVLAIGSLNNHCFISSRVLNIN